MFTNVDDMLFVLFSYIQVFLIYFKQIDLDVWK